MISILESLLADGARLLPAVAALVVAFMVLATWVRTKKALPTLGAVVVGVLVVGFLTDPGGLSTVVWSELRARGGS